MLQAAVRVWLIQILEYEKNRPERIRRKNVVKKLKRVKVKMYSVE